jgi:hypothetical protein
MIHTVVTPQGSDISRTVEMPNSGTAQAPSTTQLAQEVLQMLDELLTELRSSARLSDVERLLAKPRVQPTLQASLPAMHAVRLASSVTPTAAEISAFTALLTSCLGAVSHASGLIIKHCKEEGELDVQQTTAAALLDLSNAAVLVMAAPYIEESARWELVRECSCATGREMKSTCYYMT